MRKFLEARQSDDLRRFFPGDKIYYWTEDKSKIKSDGPHGGKWIKGKLVSVGGSMVGVDLGTRIVKVNISKIRKGHNPIEDVEVPLDPTALASADTTAKTASTTSKTTCRTEDFANTIMQHDSSLIGPEDFWGNCGSTVTAAAAFGNFLGSCFHHSLGSRRLSLGTRFAHFFSQELIPEVQSQRHLRKTAGQTPSTKEIIENPGNLSKLNISEFGCWWLIAVQKCEHLQVQLTEPAEHPSLKIKEKRKKENFTEIT